MEADSQNKSDIVKKSKLDIKTLACISRDDTSLWLTPARLLIELQCKVSKGTTLLFCFVIGLFVPPLSPLDSLRLPALVKVWKMLLTLTIPHALHWVGLV